MSTLLASPLKRPTPWRLILIILCLLILIGGIVFSRSHRSNQNTDANYTTAMVEKGDIENLVTATGILQPKDYVDVGAQVSGQLKKLYVDIGSEVKAGDLLAEIDATVYKAKVDGIRAQLKNQQAQLKDKKAQAKLAKIQFERQQHLQQDDASTVASLQEAQASLESALAQQEVLEAQIQQTESSLRVEEANLTYAKIYAPIDGTVVSITSRQGQTLNANQQAPTIMRVANLSTMTIQAQVSEADVGKIHVGMEVYFTTLAGQNNRWTGVLNQVQPTPEVTNNVVLYNALFDVANTDRRLMTQMSAQIFFIASQAKNALIIPVSALNFVITDDKPKPLFATHNNAPKGKPGEGNDTKTLNEETNKPRRRGKGKTEGHKAEGPETAVVQVLKPTGEIEARPVVLGVSSRVQVQILEGLALDEIVITGSRPVKKAPAKAPTAGAPGFGGGGFR